jgi:hypothetical protein
MRLPVFMTPIVLSLIFGLARADEGSCNLQGVRRTVRFYEYQGTQTDEKKANFGVFRKMVDDEVISANQYLFEINQPGAPVIGTEPDLNAPYASGQLSPNKGADLFAGDRKLLEALDGFLLKRPPQGPFVVHSNIYISIAQSTMTTPITENYVLDPDLFSETRSVHLAATYYALATEANDKTCKRIRIALLNKAAESLDDVKGPTPQLNAFKAAIRSELAK